MARGNGWRSGALILLLMLAAVPAGAGEGRGARGTVVVAGWEWMGEVWRSVVERIVPVEWRAKLGPEMDPDGVTAGPAGSQGTQAAPARGDLGPGMDPDGRH